MTAQDSFECEKGTENRTAIIDDPFGVVRARLLVHAAAVGEEDSEKAVVRRESLLIDADHRDE